VRVRLLVVAGLVALVARCGFCPKPKNGALPCDESCPDGYVCRADNRCWQVDTPIADGALDLVMVGRDGAGIDTSTDNGGGLTAEAGGGVRMDGAGASDITDKKDVVADGSVDVAIARFDARSGTGGAGGSGGAGGTDRSGTSGMDGGAAAASPALGVRARRARARMGQ
jgi:hypothetical protein